MEILVPATHTVAMHTSLLPVHTIRPAPPAGRTCFGSRSPDTLGPGPGTLGPGPGTLGPGRGTPEPGRGNARTGPGTLGPGRRLLGLAFAPRRRPARADAHGVDAVVAHRLDPDRGPARGDCGAAPGQPAGLGGHEPHIGRGH